MVVSVVGQATGMAAVSKDGAESTTCGLLEKPKPSFGMPNMFLIELVVGVFVVQGDKGVAAGRNLQGDGG